VGCLGGITRYLPQFHMIIPIDTIGVCIGDISDLIIGSRREGNEMPIMIGTVSGFMDGLGISLFSKGEMALGAAWFFTGLAVARALFIRVREEQKVAVKSEADRRDRRQ